jgi:hypothetical protein
LHPSPACLLRRSSLRAVRPNPFQEDGRGLGVTVLRDELAVEGAFQDRPQQLRNATSGISDFTCHVVDI